MADSILQANYEVLEDVGRDFENLSQTSQAMYMAVRNCMTTLRQEGWEGRGSDQFFAEMSEDVLPRLERLCEALEMAGRTVKTVSDLIEQAEQQARDVLNRGG